MFRDRGDAGQQLGARLSGRPLTRPLVLAIPRGGIVPAAFIAKQLNAELDVVLVRKLGAQYRPELALGAVSEDGFMVLDPEQDHLHRAVDGHLVEERRRQLTELARRQQQIRTTCPRIPVAGRSVIVVDDGIATGSTMVAALQAVRAQHPLEVIAAVPVMPASRVPYVRQSCDDLIALATPTNLSAVSQFYEDFSEVGDEEFLKLLREHACAPVSDRPRTEVNPSY